MFVDVAKQVTDHPLHARAQRIGLDVLDQAVQAHRQACDHAPRQARVAFDLGIDHGFFDMQQQRVGQALREHDVGPVGEHQRLAEALARMDDLDHFLGALRRDESQLHLAVDQRMESDAGVAALEDHLALGQAKFGRAPGDALEVIGRQLLEHRQIGQEGGGLDPQVSHGVAGFGRFRR